MVAGSFLLFSCVVVVVVAVVADLIVSFWLQ